MFACQTESQRRLLARYGKICLIDATYKTMRYAMPLFFLCVKTNVNYEVVAAFICQNETTAEIEKALSIIHEWNSDWVPQYFMSDFDEKEIHAIESAFKSSNAFVYLCDFHREQAWTRWVSKTENGVSSVKEEVLCRLRRIAMASNERRFKEAVNELKQSSVWQNHTKLQIWLDTVWLPEHKVRTESKTSRDKYLEKILRCIPLILRKYFHQMYYIFEFRTSHLFRFIQESSGYKCIQIQI